MRKVLVVAPHPDDETLGCGGTLLRHAADGDALHWVLVSGWQNYVTGESEPKEVSLSEIQAVRQVYGFTSVSNLDLPSSSLDAVPLAELIERMRQVFVKVAPEVLYLPYTFDAHSDHRVVFEAASACTKWFRQPSLRRVLAYETLSETDLSLYAALHEFNPNVFIDISHFLEKKIEVMHFYATELGEFPFPRSAQAIRALAHVRGAACGCSAAEAFVLLKEIV